MRYVVLFNNGSTIGPIGVSELGLADLTGPYYCGMNSLMTLPSFNIRLCGPISTSVQMEVALKFSKRSGIVMELDTPLKGGQYSHLHGFNASWISEFPEEDERYVIFFIIFIRNLYNLFVCLLIYLLETFLVLEAETSRDFGRGAAETEVETS